MDAQVLQLSAAASQGESAERPVKMLPYRQGIYSRCSGATRAERTTPSNHHAHVDGFGRSDGRARFYTTEDELVAECGPHRGRCYKEGVPVLVREQRRGRTRDACSRGVRMHAQAKSTGLDHAHAERVDEISSPRRARSRPLTDRTRIHGATSWRSDEQSNGC